MTFFKIAACVVGLAFSAACAVAQETELKDLRAKASYGVGLNVGRNLKRQQVDLDPDLLAKGMKDALTGAKPALTDEQIQEALVAFSEQAAKAAADRNKADGEAFLKTNKGKEGVVTLPSGLQYKVLKDGTGKLPKATDVISAHYRGTLIDGTEFDSSYRRGQPAEFPVNRVIAGWTEALQKMKVGSKWQLVIPANLAYADSPPQNSPIGPNAVLVFEVELLGIQEAK